MVASWPGQFSSLITPGWLDMSQRPKSLGLGGAPLVGRGAPFPSPTPSPARSERPRSAWACPEDGPGWQGAGLPGRGVSLRTGAWRTNEQSGANGGGACARVRRAAGRRTQAEAGVARTAGRRRPELAAGLAAVLACQAVARLRPRAPPSRSAPSLRPVRARAEAAVRRSRFSVLAVALRRVPRERRQRRPAARRSEHLPRPARRRSVSAPPDPAAEPGSPGPNTRRRPSLLRNTCCCSLFGSGRGHSRGRPCG